MFASFLHGAQSRPFCVTSRPHYDEIDSVPYSHLVPCHWVSSDEHWLAAEFRVHYADQTATNQQHLSLKSPVRDLSERQTLEPCRFPSAALTIYLGYCRYRTKR